jgi:hypothetical protein
VERNKKIQSAIKNRCHLSFLSFFSKKGSTVVDDVCHHRAFSLSPCFHTMSLLFKPIHVSPRSSPRLVCYLELQRVADVAWPDFNFCGVNFWPTPPPMDGSSHHSLAATSSLRTRTGEMLMQSILSMWLFLFLFLAHSFLALVAAGRRATLRKTFVLQKTFVQREPAIKPIALAHSPTHRQNGVFF